jgi:hypothetical protein
MLRAIAMFAAVTLSYPVVGLAQAVNDHQTINETYCYDYGGGYQYCATVKGEWGCVATPNGNRNCQQHTKSDWTYTGPNCSEQGSSNDHFKSLLKPAEYEYQVYNFGYKTQAVSQCDGTCIEVNYRCDFHFANGQVQRDNCTYDVQPCP